MLDIAVYPNYRNLYVYALASIHKDLHAPAKQFYIRGGNRPADGKPWYEVFGANLAALRRDANQTHPNIYVPTLRRAVELWAISKLREWCINKAGEDCEAQRATNAAIAERLDIIYTNGDPYLTAQLIFNDPDIIDFYSNNAGMTKGFSDDLKARMLANAQAVLQEAAEVFSQQFDPSPESMFSQKIRNKNR